MFSNNMIKNFTIILTGILVSSGVINAGEKERSFPDLPKAITSFGAVKAGNHMYVYGGHAGEAHVYSKDTTLNSFHRISLKSPEKWEALEEGMRIQGTSLVAHQGYIYRLGGLTVRNESKAAIDEEQGPNNARENLRSVDDFARFHIRSKKWEQLPALPSPRSSHDAIVIGHHLFVVGGWQLNGETDGAKWIDDMWILDLSDKNPAWESVPQPFKRRAVAAGAFQNDLYVIGGMDHEGNTSSEVNIYDPVDRTWKKGPNLPNGPMKGFGAAACSTPSGLYVSYYAGTVLKLNLKTDEWIEVSKMEPRRFFHRMVPSGKGELAAIGGANRKDGHLATIQSIELN